MAGWLAAATGVFRKRAEDSLPQTFELRCLCGRMISGERVRQPQIRTCPACQQPAFVLPASVYPAVRTPPKKTVVRTPRQPVAAPADLSETAATEAPATSPDRRPGRPAGGAPGPAASPRPAAAPLVKPVVVDEGPSLAERLREALQPANLHRLRRKIFTPVRSVLLGIAVVIAATSWWLSHLAARDRARDVISTAPKLAEAAFEEDDLVAAASQYSRLSEAVQLLGRDNQESRLWRQMARETTASTNLVDAPLGEIFQDAVESASSDARALWPDRFRAHYRDDWIVIDAAVSRVDDGAGRTSFRIDYPLAFGTVRGRVIAHLPEFERLVPAGTQSQRIVFAGQLADCRFDPAEGQWLIELRPGTAFLWCQARTLERLGLPPDPDTLKILAAQSAATGLEP